MLGVARLGIGWDIDLSVSGGDFPDIAIRINRRRRSNGYSHWFQPHDADIHRMQPSANITGALQSGHFCRR